MKLTDKQIEFYHQNGFLFLEKVFSKKEIEVLYDEIEAVKKIDAPSRILEKTGAVRSVFGLHNSNPSYSIASRVARMAAPAAELLESEVYIHQSKLNTKEALIGDWWEWHQDFPYWHLEDGMPSDRVLTAMLFLDDVNEFNGPMFLVPGSHKEGIASMADKGNDKAKDEDWYQEYQDSTTYMSALTSNLKYTIDINILKSSIRKNELLSVKGAAGSILFFHGNIFHASSSNHSPWDRNVFLVTYNSVENTPDPSGGNSRPVFISETNFEPLVVLPDEALINNLDNARKT